MIDAIAFTFQTGKPWMHLPEKYGNWRGVYDRLRMWAIDGTWERVFTALMAQAYADEDLNWAVSVDSTIVRVHQHAAGARPANPPTTPSAAPGGLTTKIHLAAAGRCRPLAFHFTAGQARDAPAFTAVVARLRVPHRRGRPRTRPDKVLTDKAYSSRAIRDHLRRHGIQTVRSVSGTASRPFQNWALVPQPSVARPSQGGPVHTMPSSHPRGASPVRRSSASAG
ncbi:IS5 family transposase [Streptomyces violaceus]|uniref:IS5 family transposase n=1 Tax=Streptomyces violaceus TaxID=1936 RepID=A0ABZ1NQV2_STRVL|nr:IS5 family transposase [Streptomyces violaceus]